MIQKTSIGEKIFQIRSSEKLSRREMSELTGISASNIKNYELLGRQIPGEYLAAILSIPRFRKYTLWLMTDQVSPESGQIAPDLSPDGPGSIKLSQSEKKIG